MNLNKLLWGGLLAVGLIVGASQGANAQAVVVGYPWVTAPAPVQTYYAPVATPVTSYYAPTTSFYAPTTTYYAPTTTYYGATTSYYAPSVVAQPVTSFYAPSTTVVGAAPVATNVMYRPNPILFPRRWVSSPVVRW